MALQALDNFFTRVRAARKRLRCDNRGAWFRGVKSHEYKLTPRIYRGAKTYSLSRERELSERADKPRGGYTSSWETLARMQHYGLETRMLDWSESLGVALFFALDLLNDKRDMAAITPTVWITNPFRLAEMIRGAGKKELWFVRRDEEYDYFQRFLNKQDWPFRNPVPIVPPWLNERIRAQKGYFTVHGNDQSPICQQFRDDVVKIKLTSAEAEAAEEFLNLAGIDAQLLFPDYDVLNDYISDTYK